MSDATKRTTANPGNPRPGNRSSSAEDGTSADLIMTEDWSGKPGKPNDSGSRSWRDADIGTSGESSPGDAGSDPDDPARQAGA
jgi:hypothetical protein